MNNLIIVVHLDNREDGERSPPAARKEDDKQFRASATGRLAVPHPAETQISPGAQRTCMELGASLDAGRAGDSIARYGMKRRM
jgi:hypothetical protein